MTTSERPIGVFDSGVGGVSVLREIRRTLPAEDLIYLADSAYTPYGDRPAAVITERAITMVTLLERIRELEAQLCDLRAQLPERH